MVFRVLIVAFATFSTIIGNPLGGLPVPGPEEKLKINLVTIVKTSNEYISYTSISPDAGHFSSTANVNIIKTLPEDLMARVFINYQEQDLPVIEFHVCSSMKDKVFVDDVVSRGLPKETFPRACPIRPGNYTVYEYEFTSDKIPRGTLPGPVKVTIHLKRSESKEVILQVYGEGEIVASFGK